MAGEKNLGEKRGRSVGVALPLQNSYHARAYGHNTLHPASVSLGANLNQSSVLQHLPIRSG